MVSSCSVLVRAADYDIEPGTAVRVAVLDDAGRRGRSGRITSPETVRSYTSALPTAFAGITDLAELTGAGRDRLHTNIHTA